MISDTAIIVICSLLYVSTLFYMLLKNQTDIKKQYIMHDAYIKAEIEKEKLRCIGIQNGSKVSPKVKQDERE